MNIQIEIINVGEPVVTKTARGQYSQIEVAYKKDGKVEGKKLVSFVHADVYEAARTWKAGQVVNLEIGKEPSRDGKEYWQWQKVLGADATNSVVGNKTPAKEIGSKTVSQYETREERQKRQQFIIRQSSVERALEYLVANGNKKFGTSDLFTVAEEIVSFVNNEPKEAAAVEIPGFENFEDDIPL